MDFDKMTAEQVKVYIESTDPEILNAELDLCTFACLRRTYEKYFGFKPTSTMSREYVQSSFARFMWQRDRAHKLLQH